MPKLTKSGRRKEYNWCSRHQVVHKKKGWVVFYQLKDSVTEEPIGYLRFIKHAKLLTKVLNDNS
jgi:hypothetical protein